MPETNKSGVEINNTKKDTAPMIPIDTEQRTKDFDTINQQELLANKIEGFEAYGLAHFYKGMDQKQQVQFIKNLHERGVNPNDFNVTGARCNTFAVMGKDGTEINGGVIQIESKGGHVIFPAGDSCGKGGKIPTMEDYIFKFNYENGFRNITEKLSLTELEKLAQTITNTSAKDFLEKGDVKLFNKAYEQYDKLPNQIKQNILRKIQALYQKDFPELKTATIASISLGFHNGQKNFQIGGMGYQFGE